MIISDTSKINVWLDCDPGHDDMLAIIMATLSDPINLLGVSTSAGNSNIHNTTQNALNILYQIGATNIQVVKGSVGPLCCALETAEQTHGLSGLEGATLAQSPNKPIQILPILHIFQELSKQQNKSVELVVTGALTNIALLLRTFPTIKQKIKRICLMGGAIGLGNWSPAAEFNILVDPEAASMVFSEGLPIVMIPLQVTHTVLITEDIFSQISTLTSNFGQKLPPLFRYFQKQYKLTQDFDFPVAHDPCTIHYLLHPEDFKGRQAHVEIELLGKSRGRTNCTFLYQLENKKPNAFVCEKINVPNFWKAMVNCLRLIK